jgi:hypothetical protein
MQLEESGTEGRKWLSKPEPYIGCSALEEDNDVMAVNGGWKL